MNHKRSEENTFTQDDKENLSDLRQAAPNPKLPWCSACKQHTDYHLKIVERNPKTGKEKTANFYTCDECGGDTSKPTYPLAVNLVSILLVGFLLWITMYALGDLDKDLRRLIFPFVTFYLAFLLYKNSRKNSAHWREFDAWAKSKRKSLKKNETGVSSGKLMG